jgi:hypothetical protein
MLWLEDEYVAGVSEGAILSNWKEMYQKVKDR